MHRILVGIPAFNEEKTIGNIVTQAKKYANMVIVVNDGSVDNTSFVAKTSGAFVIDLKRNCGVGAAIQTIFDYARYYQRKNGECILITLDADGQHFPDDIPKMVATFFSEKCDIVIGCRMNHRMDLSLYKRILNRSASWFIRRMTSYPNITDSESGFRLHSSRVIENLEFFSNDYGWNSEALIALHKMNAVIKEVNVKTVWGIVSPGHKRRGIIYGVRILFRLWLMNHNFIFMYRDYEIEQTQHEAIKEANLIEQQARTN